MSIYAPHVFDPSLSYDFDSRSEHRRRTLKAGRVVINETFSTIDVVIRDLSTSGARLRFDQPCLLPDMFELVILNTNTCAPEHRMCLRRWQQGCEVGVQFRPLT